MAHISSQATASSWAWLLSTRQGPPGSAIRWSWCGRHCNLRLRRTHIVLCRPGTGARIKRNRTCVSYKPTGHASTTGRVVFVVFYGTVSSNGRHPMVFCGTAQHSIVSCAPRTKIHKFDPHLQRQHLNPNRFQPDRSVP